MAFDRTQFNLLFPRDKKPDWDPISPTPVDTQAEEIMQNAPSASPDPVKRLPITPLEGTAQDDSGFMENIGRLFGAGSVQVGEMGVGALEYGARKFDATSGIVADTLYSSRRGLAEAREGILAGISEEDRRKVEGELLTLDPNRTIWTSPGDAAEAIIYKTVQALPATLVTMIPAIRWARAASPGTAVAYMGASEGVMSTGAIANGITDEIMSIPTEQLLQESPRFAELLEASGGNVDDARDRLILEAQGLAPIAGGATVAAISAVAGRYFTPIFEKGGGASLGRRFAQGFAAEAPQEGAQGASEQLVQNFAARIYDLDRQLSEGVAEAAVQEGLIGGLMGGGAGAMFGQGPTPTPPPPDPNAPPQMGLPGIPPGGPAATLPDELDQPMPEPQGDLEAQIADLTNPDSPRKGVYIAPGTDERLVASIAETLPEELVFTRDVDGQGGHLITKGAELGLRAQEAIQNGTSRQAVIGRIVGAGVGKPTDPNSRVVQLLDDQGFVARESMVANQQEAEALGVKWSKEKGNKGRQIIVLTPEEAIERREVIGDKPADYGVQKDLFKDQPARPPAVVPPPEGGQQLDLPLTRGRERGRGRVPLPPREIEEQQNEDLPYDVDRPVNQRQDPYEVSRRQFGMDFDTPATETRNTRTQRRVKTGDIAVQVIDNGEVVETHLFGSQQAADEYADQLAQEFPDFQIRMAPATRTEEGVQTRARRGEARPIEPVYETPIEDEVREDIRATIPFEERAEPLAAVEGVRSFGQASDRLIGEAAAAREEDNRTRIGGFYNPDTLAFDNPEYEAAYREAWNNALGAELIMEMSQQKQAVEQAKKKRQAALVEMGKVRQVAKPKRKPGKAEVMTKAAQAVNPAEVRALKDTRARENEPEPGPRPPGTATPQRATEEDFLGELEYLDREQIDKLEGRALDEVFERAMLAREGREASSAKRNKKPTKEEQEVEEIKEEIVGKPTVKVETGKPKELSGGLGFTDRVDDEGEFVEPETDPTLYADEVEYEAQVDRSQYDTPGKKKKEIRREMEHLRRKETGQRSIKATPVRRSATKSRVKRKEGESEQDYNKRVRTSEGRKKFDTAPLTQENYTLDESVAGRVKRIAAAKKARAEVGKAATRAATHLRKLKGKKRTEGMSEKVKKDFLYARNYLEQLIQFARSIQKSGSESNQTTKLAEGVKNMLDAASTLTDEQFASQWGAVAKANEFDDLANFRFTNLASLRNPAKRAKATRETNNRVAANKRIRMLNEHLKNDQLYQRMIGPVLMKMSQYIEDTVNGIATMPYIPNEIELAELRYAMQTLKNNWSPARLSDMGQNMQREFAEFAVDKKINIYDPIKKQMEFVGFRFEGLSGFEYNESLSGFLASEEYLGARYNERFKGVKEKGTAEIQRGVQQTLGGLSGTTAPAISTNPVKGLAVEIKVVEEKAATDDEAIKEAIANLDRRKKEQAGKVKPQARERQRVPGPLTVDTVNGLISRFQKATRAAKTTRNAIKRAEERFIRGLKRIGAWRQTGADIGIIDVPGVKTRIWRMVGPRLDAKTTTNPKARQAIQKIAQFKIPREMIEEVEAARDDNPAGVEEFLSESDLDLFSEAAQPTKFDAEYTGVADRIGEMLTAGIVRGNDIINAILEIAPQNSFYRNLASLLAKRDVGNTKVLFGTQEDFPKGQPAKFNRKSNTIFINRDVLNMDRLGNDPTYGARVVHAMTHELIHAQTHLSIDNNLTLRRRLEAMQQRARDRWRKRVGTSLPYGLKVLEKSENEVHEFVAEAFSNHEFKKFLKETPREAQTIGDLWRSFVEAIRGILGLEFVEVKNNLFDAIMMTEDVLFDDGGFGGSVSQGDLYLTGDAVADNISTFTGEMIEKSIPIMDKLKAWGRNLVTFDQLYDMYQKHFTDGSFARYMDAFKRRNSAISKHMKVPERLSVRWTELEASQPEMALELSRIGTEATIDRLTPSKSLTAKEREAVSKSRLERYDTLRARYKRMSPEAQSLYSDLVSYYKGVAKEEAQLMMSASLRGILTKGPNSPLTAAQFEAAFSNTTIEKMVDKESITEALRGHVKEDELKGFVEQIQRMASLRTIGYGDYFPLMRYGNFVVYKAVELPDKTFADYGDAAAKRKELLDDDPTLDVSLIKQGDKTILRVIEKEFWMFERKTDAMNKANELGVEVDVRINQEANNGTAISSNAALRSVLTSLEGNPAAQTAIKNLYLRNLADNAFRKHELKRKNRAGVNYDIQHRNLANYLKQSAYYRAQMEYGWRMGEALQDMQEFVSKRERGATDITKEQLRQVANQVAMRDQMTNDGTELLKLVRKGVNLTQFMMLTSPSYWMINMSQPWLVTAPIMGGKHGFGNSYAALKDAFNLIKGPLSKEAWESKFGLKAFTDPVQTEKAFNVVDQLIDHINRSGDPRASQFVELIEELRDINIIDINVLTELRQIAEGVQGGLATNTLDASRILGHLTEVSNRVVTAIAAYNLAINNGDSVAEAKKYAADMVSQTQFNYSSENKPPLFQPGGPLKWAAPLMFQFMQWPQHMYALLIRNVHGAMFDKTLSDEEKAAYRKSTLGLLGTHLAVGGMIGMALQPIKFALGMAMMAFGDEDEPYTFANAISGRTFDNMMAGIMTELFGDTMGRAVSHGLPTLLGTDLSARMSMGTLYFVDLRGDTAESVLGSFAASFGGATLNQVMNWGNALNKVAQGDVFRGVEQASPKIARDALRAIRYYNEGLINNAGDSVIPAKDLSFAEVFLQGIGFSPDEVSKFYSGQTAIKGAQGYARDRRDQIIRSFVEDGMSSETMREVTEFNRAYPSMRITRSTLIRGARGQVERETRYQQYGANIDDKEATDFGPYADPYR